MKKLIFVVSFIAIFFTSCTEPYALQSSNFQDVLVIEGTITNELKNQEIKVSRSLPIDVQFPDIVKNATVLVVDDSGITYPFTLQNNSYKSNNPFQAEAGKQYKLVVSVNGQTYESNLQAVPDVANIQDIEAKVLTKNNGSRGVSITVNSEKSESESKFYRFDYEETFIVKPPRWVSQDLIYNGLANTFDLIPRNINTSLCYSTINSAEIITTTTADLLENKIDNFEIAFLSNTNYKISYRYSILAKQYLLNQDAYSYYNQLKTAQNSEGTELSPAQPGFITGNIKNIANLSEKIVGFFDVATVSEKRFFFNYNDLFPSEPIPPYFNSCELRDIDSVDEDARNILINNLSNNLLVYFSQTGFVYQLVPPVCGDCTYFSNPIKPSFWID